MLSRLLVDSKSLAEVRAILAPSDFWQSAHRRIYAVLCEIADDGHDPTDPVELKARLDDLDVWNYANSVAPPDVVMPTPDQAIEYARRIARLARERQLQHASETYAASPTSEHLERLDAARGALDLAAVASDTSEKRVVQSRTAAEIATLPLPEPRWCVTGLIPAGLVLLVGKPKCGKSWLGLNLAHAVATGGLALGTFRVDAGDALVAGLEDTTRRFRDRLDALLAEREGYPERLHFVTDLPRMREGQHKATCDCGLCWGDRWLDEHPDCRLVVIDTLARFRPTTRGRNVNLYELDTSVGHDVQRLAVKHNVAVMVVHHERKLEAADPLDTVSGSVGLAGCADGILLLRRERLPGIHADDRAPRTKTNAAVLYVDGRDVEEATVALEFDNGLWTAVGDAEEFRMTRERAEVKAVLKGAPEPMTPTEVAAALEKPVGTIKARLFKMHRDGQVLRTNNGRYYTEDADDGDGNDAGQPRQPW